MIENTHVLDQGFLPAEIQNRDGDTSHLSDNLRPITRGERAETSFLFGPSEAGKTCVAQFTVNQLVETVGGVETGYLNCWEREIETSSPTGRAHSPQLRGQFPLDGSPLRRGNLSRTNQEPVKRELPSELY